MSDRSGLGRLFRGEVARKIRRSSGTVTSLSGFTAPEDVPVEDVSLED